MKSAYGRCYYLDMGFLTGGMVINLQTALNKLLVECC